MKLSIREAAQKMKVETHVLRFWEEELGLLIPRNEMGHRYYGESELELLKDVQKLKEKGFSLRAIKILLPETELVNQLDDFGLEILKEELEKRFHEEEEEQPPKIETIKEASLKTGAKFRNSPPEETAKAEDLSVGPAQLVEVFKALFEEVMERNNQLLLKCLEENNKQTIQMQKKLSEGILKEMDYRLRMQEEAQEQYFKNLDEMVKNIQGGQAAATLETGKKRRFFGRKG